MNLTLIIASLLIKTPIQAETVDLGLNGRVFAVDPTPLGNGQNKTVHRILERPDLVLAKTRIVPSQSGYVRNVEKLKREMKTLEVLSTKNIRTVEFYPRLVTGTGNAFSVADKTKRGLDEASDFIGYVMRFYDAGNKDHLGLDFFERMNSRSIRDLVGISLSIRRHGLTIFDLQFLVDHKGRVRINDPLGYQTNSFKLSSKLFSPFDPVRPNLESHFAYRSGNYDMKRVKLFWNEYSEVLKKKTSLERLRRSRKQHIIKVRAIKKIDALRKSKKRR